MAVLVASGRSAHRLTCGPHDVRDSIRVRDHKHCTGHDRSFRRRRDAYDICGPLSCGPQAVDHKLWTTSVGRRYAQTPVTSGRCGHSPMP